MNSKDELCINTLRFLAVDAVERAQSGHPGLPLGAAPMAYVIWDRFLRHNPKNPHWFDRDRFVLSAGHGRPVRGTTAGQDEYEPQHGPSEDWKGALARKRV